MEQLLEFKLKTVTKDNENSIQNSTLYLFNKKQKILLPIKMNVYAANNVLLAHDCENEPRPHIHNTVARTIRALKGRLKSIVLYGYQGEIFYSYLRITSGKGKEIVEIDIDSKPSDSISIAIRENLPIYVGKSVYERAGIKVTKELLDASLF